MLLQLRGTVYYLRTRIPADLHDLIGRAEIKQTLRTSNRRDAKKLCRLRSADVERMFTQLRLGRNAMNDTQLKRFADKLLADFLGKTEKHRQTGADVFEIPLAEIPEGFDQDGIFALTPTLSRQRTAEGLDHAAEYHKQRIASLREELRFGRYSESTRDLARRRVQEDKLNVELPPASWFVPSWMAGTAELPDVYFSRIPEPEVAESVKGAKKAKAKDLEIVSTWDEQPPAEFATLCRTIVQTLLEGHEVELERVNGIYSTDRQMKVEERLKAAARGFTVNDLWASYRDRKVAGDEWSSTTKEKYEGFVKALNKTLEEDHDFSSYEDVDEVTKLILKLKEYKSSRTGEKWSASSVNDCLVFLSTLYRYAIRNRKFGITFNPFEARQIAETDSKKREALTPEELAAVWRGLQKVRGNAKKTDLYWVMLMMLYTGARIGEVCQLRLDDFEKIGDHWVVHYRSRPELGQSIKGEKRKQKKRPNEEVDRITAIHPHLRTLGLFKHIDKLKESGEQKLFPKEKRTNGRSGVLMAKKVKTFFGQCLGKDTEKSAHYCRHTLISWFKANVNLTHTEASLISAMVGHEDEVIGGGNKITWGTYGGAHSVKQMYGVIKQLDYGFLI